MYLFTNSKSGRYRADDAFGYPGADALAGFGQAGVGATATEPSFRFDCPAGTNCGIGSEAQCRAVLRQAVRAAIKLANDAAGKLEARDPAIEEFFRFFFNHPTNRPIPWAGGEESAVSVAKRFRAVAKALQKGGRHTTLRCLPTTAGCADDDLTCCSTGANAWVNPAGEANVLNLCATFWTPPAGLRGLPAPYYRAGVIIHEMLHLLYRDFLLHGARRANAHCYEAFALRAAGYGVDPIDICMCRGTTPCPPP